jgi:hypothetical protein
MLRTVLALGLTLAVATPAFAQRHDSRFGRSNDDWCADAGHNSDRASYCEVREMTIGAAGTIDIDAGRNGGISVRGWDRGDAMVRARVVGYGATRADAQRIASEVRLDTAGGVKAEGPASDGDRDEGWYVSYEVSVPKSAMLKLTANNGGIAVEDFAGTATFHTKNGGISLRDVGGDLRGETTNGGVSVELAGDRWNGAGLDVTTRNGGINIQMPEHYSAELEVATTHGRLNLGVPVTVQGTIGRSLTTVLGGGGARLRAVTTNGGVNVRTR